MENCGRKWRQYGGLFLCLAVTMAISGCGEESGGENMREESSTPATSATTELSEWEYAKEQVEFKKGEVTVSEDGRIIYVKGGVYYSQISDERTKQAEKIVFSKNAHFYPEELVEGGYNYYSYLRRAPHVKTIEVEEGNPNLYVRNDMLIEKDDEGSETIVVCAPAKEGEIRIPEGIDCIGLGCFNGCSKITSVSLPASIKITHGSLSNMASCTGITVDEKNENYYAEEGVLYSVHPSNTSLPDGLIAYPSGKKDKSYDVTERAGNIESAAFMGAQYLEEVHLPGGFTGILDQAFRGCQNLQKVIIDGDRMIDLVENSSYADCPKLKEKVISEDYEPNQWCDPEAEELEAEYAEEQLKKGEVSVSEDGKTIYVKGWVYYTRLSDKRTKRAEKIVFSRDAHLCSEWVEDGDYNCDYYSYLSKAPRISEIEVEKGNPELYVWNDMLVQKDAEGDKTIVVCVPAKKGDIQIPEGIDWIGPGCFNGCSKITSVSLPATIGVSEGSLSNMASCTKITVDKKNQNYYTKDGVLYEIVPTYPGEPDEDELAAYPAGKKGKRYDVWKKTKKIQGAAFMGARYLKEVRLPSKLNVISYQAFRGCKSLERVMIKGLGLVDYVYEYAYKDCPKLKEKVTGESYNDGEYVLTFY